MHRHTPCITYYTQSTVCQGGFSNKFLSSSSWAYAGFAKGVQQLLGGRIHAFARGFGGMLPRKKILMVRFGAYFHKFLLSKSLKILFLYKNNYKL